MDAPCDHWFAMTGGGRGRRGYGPPFGRGVPFAPFFFGRPGGFTRGPRARRGDIRTAALILLAEESRNGYQLMQEIEHRSNGVWRPSPGSVYPALAQLEDEGLVRVEERDERHDELVAPWEEMSDSVDEDVASLFGELRQVAMATAQIAHVGTAEQVAEARAALANVRRALYSLLAEDEPDA